MDRNLRFFSYGILIFLIVVLGLWFVLAVSTPTLVAPAVNANISGTYTFNSTITDDNAVNVTFYWWNSTGTSWKLLCYNGTTGAGPFTCSYDTSNIPDGTSYTFNATAENATATFASDTSTGVTLDNTAPVITIALPSAGWNAGTINIYTNSTDATTNVTNSTMYFWFGNSTGNFSKTLLTSCPYVSAATGFNCSTTFDTDNLADGNYTLWINASDTMATPNVKNQSKTLIGVDNTNPIPGASCSPTTIYSGSSFPCACSGSDATSGVSTISDSSTSGTVANTNLAGIFTYTCNVTDIAGNSASATTTYTVLQSSGSSSVTPSLSKKTHSWAKITPGVAAIMKDFDSEIGIKQIRVRVRNEVQNVEITVTKYDTKPAEVSVAKTGETYQYLHINAENFGEDLEQATIEFRAERTWAVGANLGKNDIIVSKYNEIASRWDDLTTTSTGEDATYYYYDVELDEFSYFTIAEKAVVGEEEPPAEEEGGVSALVWILIAVIILALIFWQMKIKKK